MTEIQNPNQSGGGQDWRTLMLFAAVFLAIFLGLQYFAPKKATTAPANAPAASDSAAHPENSAAAESAPSAVAAGAQPSAENTAGTIEAAAENTTVVENKLYRITFSNRGGQATSWILKNYKDNQGKPLDLINQKAAAKMGFPLSLWTADQALRTRLAQALYVPSATGDLNAPAQLSFTYASGGLTITKNFSFDADYVVSAKVTAVNDGRPVDVFLAWPSGFGDQETLPDYAQNRVDMMQNGKSDDLAVKKVNNGATLNGPFDWVGVSDLYFGAIFLPDAPAQAAVTTLHGEMTIPRNLAEPNGATYSAPVLGAALGGPGGSIDTRLFAGPKVIDVLNAVHATGPDGAATGPTLEPILNFGFWGFIAKPLFLLLRWVHEHVVANWGWAILVLTLAITLAMLPTRVKMMKSSLKMQRIQPEMTAIREKYKKYKTNDPRRADMNKEIFDLQKREGVNMFGGCLPMLIQYPLLYGFYRMLGNVIELRQAHWYWLHNLAAPDPLHILPIFFIVTMFLVQYLTPSPGMDPKQQKMMAFTMPVFFGYMTWNLGAGLTLYWAFSNVINVIQQAIMNRTGMGKQMREIAARRAAKRSGKQMARR